MNNHFSISHRTLILLALFSVLMPGVQLIAQKAKSQKTEKTSAGSQIRNQRQDLIQWLCLGLSSEA